MFLLFQKNRTKTGEKGKKMTNPGQNMTENVFFFY